MEFVYRYKSGRSSISSISPDLQTAIAQLGRSSFPVIVLTADHSQPTTRLSSVVGRRSPQPEADFSHDILVCFQRRGRELIMQVVLRGLGLDERQKQQLGDPDDQREQQNRYWR